MNSEILPHESAPPPSRRRFIRNAGAAALAFCAPAARSLAGKESPAEKIPVGSNIYGWGQYYKKMNKNVQDNLGEVLSALRDAGYDYLEGFLDVKEPANNAAFAEQMRAKGLRPVCLYAGPRLHEEGKAGEAVQELLAAAKVCRDAGFKIIDCNPAPIGREKTDDELKTQAAALTDLGKGLKRLGMTLGVHNHLPEMKSEAREFHHNFRRTDAADVGFCYDVHWVFRGGIAPADALRDYGNRIVSWHLRQSREKIWWEDLDTGDIDYAAVAAWAREHGTNAPYTVELALENGTKITRSVVENHQRSREFVRRAFGV